MKQTLSPQQITFFNHHSFLELEDLINESDANELMQHSRSLPPSHGRDLWRIDPWIKAITMRKLYVNLASELFQEKHLPFAPARTIDEVANCPQLNERGYFTEIDHPLTGIMKYPGTAYTFSKSSTKKSHPAPLLGEHNEMIYCERLKYSREDLAGLRKGGII